MWISVKVLYESLTNCRCWDFPFENFFFFLSIIPSHRDEPFCRVLHNGCATQAQKYFNSMWMLQLPSYCITVNAILTKPLIFTSFSSSLLHFRVEHLDFIRKCIWKRRADYFNLVIRNPYLFNIPQTVSLFFNWLLYIQQRVNQSRNKCTINYTDAVINTLSTVIC